jgi:hypothetical protein
MEYYSIKLSQDGWDSPGFRGAWASLIAGCRDPYVLGKSPEYLDHLRGTNERSQFHLATVRDGAGATVGVVPLRVMRSGLRYDVAGRVLWESRTRAVSVLGGLPLLPADPAAHDLLLVALDEGFGCCQAVALPGVPTGSFLWNHVHESRTVRGRFIPYATHGVRGCHTIPLPATVQEYRARFSAKKRYNLGRQVRILRDHCGGRLELRRFETPEQVGDLVSAVNETRRSAGLTLWGGAGAFTIDRREAEGLASRGLLLTYLLVCAGHPCAALTGLQYRGVYYLHAIPRDRSLDRFSPGATALHLAIEDLIRDTSIVRVDLGFGEPVHPHSSLNVIEPRASLLLFRRTLTNRLRKGSHSVFRSLVNLAKPYVAAPSGSRSRPAMVVLESRWGCGS